MADGIQVDFTDLLSLAADLGRAPAEASKNVRKATEVTARYVKDDWRQQADVSGLAGYAADIDYELVSKAGMIGADIGPTIGDMGSMGFVEEGGAEVYSAPQHAASDAVRANEPDYVRGLLIAISEPLEGA